jgi:Flp pilus assembly pilin Flp
MGNPTTVFRRLALCAQLEWRQAVPEDRNLNTSDDRRYYMWTYDPQQLRFNSCQFPRPGQDRTGTENKMKSYLLRLWKEEEGQDLTEYALLLVLIALTAIVVMSNLGSAVNRVFSSGSSTLNSAAT